MQKKFHHRYTLHALIVALVVTVGGILFAVHQLSTATTFPDNNSTGIIGVLLDQNNGYVDFSKLEQKNIDFVYLRSTQGKSYFDDRYLENRERLAGANLDYGTVQFFSNESSATDQFNYFRQKVGQQTGILPVLVMPTGDYHGKKFWQQLALFTKLLNQTGDQVIVLANYQDSHAYFRGQDVRFMLPDKKRRHSPQNYLFWRYTSTGRIKDMAQMDDLSMFSFIGNQSSYNRLVGRN